jgi:uncharacterized protein YaeQ
VIVLDRHSGELVARTATVHHVEVLLSDVDRGVYATLDLRIARHPSETMRYLVTRLLAYCLSYEEGIGFSKGGLSDPHEPPLSIRRLTGELVAWIDVGIPSAERLHKATKAAERVRVFTSADLGQLRREAGRQRIHDQDKVEIVRLDAPFLDAMAEKMAKTTRMELTVTGGHLYAAIDGSIEETTLVRAGLREEP